MAKYPKKTRTKARPKRKRSKAQFIKCKDYRDVAESIPQTDFWGTEVFRDFCSSTHGPLDFEGPGIGPLPPQAPIVTKLEPLPGTMLNPAERAAVLDEYNDYCNISDFIHSSFKHQLQNEGTRWSRFKSWFVYTFIS
jgi:hypothetical protein